MAYEDIKDKGFDSRTTAERQQLAIKAGQASGEARRRKRDIRLALEALLEKDISDKHGNTMTTTEAIALKQIEKALKGDTKAFEVVRDTVGQKPIDKVAVTNIDQSLGELNEYFGRQESPDDTPATK